MLLQSEWSLSLSPIGLCINTRRITPGANEM
jgi:hypothetical protein